MPEFVRLDEVTINAIASRLADVLRQETKPERLPLCTASEVARRLNVKPSWVRENADRLGAVRLGDGPRAPLRFDVELVLERLTARSLLLAIGEEVPYVMQQAGHADPRMTLGIYGKVMFRRDGERDRLRALVRGEFSRVTEEPHPTQLEDRTSWAVSPIGEGF